ncbi:MAG TPA: sigma-70 family RNA polymerase sigma factor [Candidatus Saccharimonadales bacterium]|nr:sigma-70 family RNA polymerase sigma factor [Candidatus Saccharimonadales bacterium]
MKTYADAQSIGPQTRRSGAARSAPAESRCGDAFQLYLREIGQVELLTPEEEISLAERIKRGDEEAREQMIKANLRLVVSIAREFEGFGLPLLDLISEGNIGLMKGVERFEPAKGAKLSTYAAWWIKHSIRLALVNQSKIIRLPVHVTHQVAHIRRAEIRLRETLDREATDQEVADDLELDPKRVRQYRAAARAPVCLDAPIGGEDSMAISETLADENAAAPFDRLVRANEHDLVHGVLSTIPARKRSILAMRFGLDDGRSKTLEEIAAHFGINRERIRQIQEDALEEMRLRIERRDRLSSSGLAQAS